MVYTYTSIRVFVNLTTDRTSNSIPVRVNPRQPRAHKISCSGVSLLGFIINDLDGSQRACTTTANQTKFVLRRGADGDFARVFQPENVA